MNEQDIRPTADSVLFITLDSCRYDTFAAAHAPALKAVGELRAAQSPGYFTYASHCAMFVGFTPVATPEPTPFLNPKYAKLFKLHGGGSPGLAEAGYVLEGETIVAGFEAEGFMTIGTGAVGWFDPSTPAGRHLSSPFQRFLYDGAPGACGRQLAWVEAELEAAAGRPVFLFVNLGETHTPYWHEGASWPHGDNPCLPFQTADRRADCETRQRACLEHLDGRLASLLERFSGSTILVCADHGDAWGEAGVWEHGVPHPMVLTVPLLMRVRGRPI